MIRKAKSRNSISRVIMMRRMKTFHASMSQSAGCQHNSSGAFEVLAKENETEQLDLTKQVTFMLHRNAYVKLFVYS